MISFASENLGGNSFYGNELTNVSVSAVPETSTWMMMARLRRPWLPPDEGRLVTLAARSTKGVQD